MTIKESRFIANSFREYCIRYNHMPVFFPLATGPAAEKIRSRPWEFESMVNSFYYNALREMRGLPYYENAIAELQEIAFLANNPAECKIFQHVTFFDFSSDTRIANFAQSLYTGIMKPEKE